MQIVRWICAAPCVFLVHDAEEIIAVSPWLSNHRSALPAVVQPFASITTEQFAIGVGVLFVALLATALHGVQRARIGKRSIPFLLVAGALVGNGLTHLAHAAAFRGYTPGLFTAVSLVIPYGIGLGVELRATRLLSGWRWLGLIALGALLQIPIIAGILAAVQ